MGIAQKWYNEKKTTRREVHALSKKCGATKSSVVDSRQAEEGNTIRRRRECDECQHRFTTYERVEERTLVVVKKTVRESSFREIKSLMGLSAQPRSVLCQVMKSTWWLQSH